MPKSSGNEPKYLTCTRALALLTGLAGGVIVAARTANANPDAGEPQPQASVYDGGVHGVLVNSDGGCGCDLGGESASTRGSVAAGLAGAGLIARRRRRSDLP